MYSDDIAERFWSKVAIRDWGSCWEWCGTHDRDGYGLFAYERKLVRAHRMSYTLWYGAIPEGMWILHSCDNPRCCSPAHLHIGTSSDNVREMWRRGRGPRNLTPPPSMRGESHPEAKLTDADVAEMRRLGATGRYTQRQLAKRFGVSFQHVSKILRYKRWRHVPDEPAQMEVAA